MNNEIIEKQLNELCERLSFAPAISMVKAHKLHNYVTTEQTLKDFFHITDDYIVKMNRIRTDEYFGGDTGEQYLYLIQEAVFLGLILENKSTGIDEAMELYNSLLTITI